MPGSFSDGEEDAFFDASDDIRSSWEASVGCSTSDEVSARWRPEFQLWANELMSVKERRQRFMKEMAIAEPVATGMPISHWQGYATANCSFHDLEERIISICSSFRSSSFSDNVLAPDSACCIRDLDTGKSFVVHEGQHGGLNGMFREVGSDKMMTAKEFEGLLGFSHLVQKLLRKGSCHGPARETKASIISAKQKDFKSFLRSFTRTAGPAKICMRDPHAKNLVTAGTLSRTQVHQQSKEWMDFSAVYMCQEIQAHKGLIRVMKFSPSGWYLASGGEDCVVRMWLIREVESSPVLYGREAPLERINKPKGLTKKMTSQSNALAIIPKKVFSISETPLHEFHGHTGDIIDMAWSNSDFLLTSSKDKTARLWKVGCDGCLAVFKHTDYVTCVQFNPVDQRYFISGSIDGKVRIWDALEKRVADWADARDIITALSYQQDGKGFVVGTVAGTCRFYDQSGQNMQLNKVMHVKPGKKSPANKITSLQLFGGDSSRLIISSADYKIRISDGACIIQKFEGPKSSKVLPPPSLTSDGRYLISGGRDSNVHIWNFDASPRERKKRGPRSVRSCELFFSDGVTAVAPWTGALHSSSSCRHAPRLCRGRECCSFGTWFLAGGGGGGAASAATWPEEELLPSLKYVSCAGLDDDRGRPMAPVAWNTVIVTGSRDGVIRAFHNYGLPVRL